MPLPQELLRGQPLQLQVAGLHVFGRDPSAAHVVYLGAEEVVPSAAGGQGRLAPLVRYVVGAFKRAGLMLPVGGELSHCQMDGMGRVGSVIKVTLVHITWLSDDWSREGTTGAGMGGFCGTLEGWCGGVLGCPTCWCLL